MEGATKTATRVLAEPPAGKPEQRREPRYLPNKLVEILPCANRKHWEFKSAELCDCSTNGVGLISDEPLAVGEQFILKVKLMKWVLLHYRVRYCAPASIRGHFRIGAELIGYLDATQHRDADAVLAAMVEDIREDASG